MLQGKMEVLPKSRTPPQTGGSKKLGAPLVHGGGG